MTMPEETFTLVVGRLDLRGGLLEKPEVHFLSGQLITILSTQLATSTYALSGMARKTNDAVVDE